MPEETTAQPATPAASAVMVRPATPPPATGESFFQRMERHGGFGDEPAAPEPADKEPEAKPETEKPAVEAKPADKPAKGKKAGKGKEPEKADKPAESKAEPAAETTPEQKLETFRLMAKELGLVIDDGKVVANERAELRIAKRDHQRRVADQERELVGKYNEAISAVQPELDKARAVIKALDEGDADELAKLSGAKDWNEAQERFIAKLTDPNFKKIRDLERQVEADKRAKEEHDQRTRQQSEQNRRLEAQRVWRVKLAKEMQASQDPICREMAEDPAFVDAIFQIQRENWDEERNETVTAEQALKMAIKGAPMSVREELEQHYRRLHKVFGPIVAAATAAATPPAPASAEAEKAATDKPGARPRPKTGVAPGATGGAPSPAGKFKTQAERRAYNLARLKEATESERRAV